MVELVRSGRTAEELSREFELTAQAIWNWVRQTEREAGHRTIRAFISSLKGPSLNNRIGRKESRVREERNERIWKLA